VPFLLRTGKRLAVSEQCVSLVLRPVEGPLSEVPGRPHPANVIRFSLAGSGGLRTQLTVKRPGPGQDLTHAIQTLDLADVEGGDPLPAYSALLNDVLLGDRSLFTSSAGLEHAWRVLDPLLRDRPEVKPYEPGSWGPAEAAELAEPGKWLLGEDESKGESKG